MDCCCDAWSDAQCAGTDNEAYGALLRRAGFDRHPDGAWLIGSSDLPPVKFCPWCGADKTKPHPLEAAARRVVDSMYGSPRGDWDDLKSAIGALADVLEKNDASAS